MVCIGALTLAYTRFVTDTRRGTAFFVLQPMESGSETISHLQARLLIKAPLRVLRYSQPGSVQAGSAMVSLRGAPSIGASAASLTLKSQENILDLLIELQTNHSFRGTGWETLIRQDLGVLCTEDLINRIRLALPVAQLSMFSFTPLRAVST